MEDKKLSLRGDALTLMNTLQWTDLIADPHDEGFLMDPETGRRWKRLSPQQERLAWEIFQGQKRREACKSVGVTTNANSASSYVSQLLSYNAPFVNHLISLHLEDRQSEFVTEKSHLQRLAELGRQAEKQGKISAAIAAEVHRGRVAGLYTKVEGRTEDPKALKTLESIDNEIKRLLGKVDEREVNAQRVISTQGKKS